MVGEPARPCRGVVTVRELFATAFGGIPVLARPWPGTFAEARALDRGIAHLATAHHAFGTAPDGPGPPTRPSTSTAEYKVFAGARGAGPSIAPGAFLRGCPGTAVLVGGFVADASRHLELGRGASCVSGARLGGWPCGLWRGPTGEELECLGCFGARFGVVDAQSLVGVADGLEGLVGEATVADEGVAVLLGTMGGGQHPVVVPLSAELGICQREFTDEVGEQAVVLQT